MTVSFLQAIRCSLGVRFRQPKLDITDWIDKRLRAILRGNRGRDAQSLECHIGFVTG